MVKIRLSRVGVKKKPFYRVVVADVDCPRDGRIIENIGTYDPHTDPATFAVDEGRAVYWLQKGAQPTDSVARFLKKQGILEKAVQEKVVQEMVGEV